MDLVYRDGEVGYYGIDASVIDDREGFICGVVQNIKIARILLGKWG